MPAVSAGLFGLCAESAGSVMRSAGGRVRSSFASMIPPRRPISSSASRTAGVSGAKGGSSPKRRPKRPLSW